jgi:hypothetical protein
MQVKNAVVSKRHYRKGIYIDLVSSRHQSPAPVTTPLPVPAPSFVKTQPVSITTPVVSAAPSGVTVSAPTAETVIPHEITTQPSGNAPTLKRYFIAQHPLLFGGRLADHDDPGYLLWTIIAVLIIIWLISLLTGGWGLGGFIYVFLVVALVLLLFRILGIF